MVRYTSAIMVNACVFIICIYNINMRACVCVGGDCGDGGDDGNGGVSSGGIATDGVLTIP